MGTLFRSYIPVTVPKTHPSKTHHRFSFHQKAIPVYCRNGDNTRKSGGLPAVLTDRTTLLTTERDMVAESSVLLKDLVPYGRSREEGIGITKFLRGKTFFITGATGFLAKILIEKILRTEPDVGKMYLLIKARNEEAAMKRLKNDIIEADLFKCLKQIHGRSYQSFMMSKLVPVVGNVSLPDLGLEEDMVNVMARDVDIIVNSAANTSFDERYDVAVEINSKGPSRLINFAKKCHKLKLFLQVSTAYVNGRRQGRLMERTFSNRVSSDLDVEAEIQMALDCKKSLKDDSSGQKLKDLGLERAKRFGWQDTYAFTKAMGEMLLDNTREDIPVVIVRPSVIESTYREPFPGWMEGNRMMDPIVLYYGKGLLTGFLANPNGVLDVIPADMVVNAIIAAMAWHGRERKSDINIYQICSSTVNPLVLQHLANMLHDHFTSTPFFDSKGEPIHVRPPKLFDSVEEFASHVGNDAIQKLGLATKKSPNGKLSKRLENLYTKSMEKAKYLADIYEPYTFYAGRFDSSNTQSLRDGMSEEERMKFGFDARSIDWEEYISNIHIPGPRRHVMKGRGIVG